MLEKLWPLKLFKKNIKRKSEDIGFRGEFPDTNTPVSKDLHFNLQWVQHETELCHDAVIRPFKIGKNPELSAFLVYIDGMVDKELLNESIIKPLMLNSQEERINCFLKDSPYDYIENHLLASANIQDTKQLEKAMSFVHSGGTAIFIDGLDKALIVGTESFSSRNVEEPMVEPVVRGPREGFTEVLRTNTALIRRKIKSSRLKIEIMEIGAVAKTQIALLYIDGLVNNMILKEARQRLKRIKIDGVLDTNYVAEFMRDNYMTPFPLLHRTEKPDVVAGEILQGKFAIIVDGSPSALIAPSLFVEYLISSEDYYINFIFATFSRWVRYLSLLISVFLPAIYVAITTYHQEMIPTTLAISIAASREGVPFPTFFEATLMGLVFEILREAGTRMPRTIGQAVSIVGTLIIGDAAISAGLTSPAMVIVTALTGLAVFAIPTPELAIALIPIRFFLLVLGAIIGLLGIMLATIALIAYLASLRSFGVPYLSPLAPLSPRDLKDVGIRAPWWMMIMRPRLIGWKRPQRQPYGQMPDPDKK